MEKIRFKKLADHVKDCGSVKQVKNGSWEFAWGVYQHTKLGSKASPLRRGSKQWIVMGCNTIGCPARLAFNLENVLIQGPAK